MQNQISNATPDLFSAALRLCLCVNPVRALVLHLLDVYFFPYITRLTLLPVEKKNLTITALPLPGENHYCTCSPENFKENSKNILSHSICSIVTAIFPTPRKSTLAP